MSDRIVASWLGRIPYLDGWRLQEAVATRVREGGPDRLLLLEHDPVYTIGKRGSEANLIAPPDVLRSNGASVYRVDRGGDITYHGPGQLVGYPVVALADKTDLVAYVRRVSGADWPQIWQFFATGMLLNVLSSMQVTDNPEPWMSELLAGCGKEL